MKKPTVQRSQSGSIFLRFTADRQRYCFAPVKSGKYDNPLHYGQAYAISNQIAVDVLAGNFDKTLEKYMPISDRKIREIEAQKDITLSEVWGKYKLFRQKQVSLSTWRISYKTISIAFRECPHSALEDATKIAEWFIQNKSTLTARKLLMQANACCEWAYSNGLLTENPFVKLKRQAPKIKRMDKDSIDPFTESERDLIIEAFHADKKGNHYAYFVEFLFAIGCRPSEAMALTWNDYTQGKLILDKAYVDGQLQKGLKAESQRTIKCSEKVKEILRKQKDYLVSKALDHKGLVFPGSRKGAYVNWGSFRRGMWNRILKGIEDVELKEPYQMRHTFITLALKQVSIQDVAKHCGNSPQIIMKHYAGVTRNFQMPDI